MARNRATSEREEYWCLADWSLSDRELERQGWGHHSSAGKWRARLAPPEHGGVVPGKGTPVPIAGSNESATCPQPRPHECANGLNDCAPATADASGTFAALSKFCSKCVRTLDEVCDYLDCGPTSAQKTIAAAQAAGHPLQLHGGRLTWHLPEEWAEDEAVTPEVPQAGGWHTVALVSDTHFGSKWERSDLLADFFREAYGRGCRTFFHVGDMLDGEYGHSLRERYAHGFDEQAQAAFERLPRGDGAHWYAVDGNHDETLTKAAGAVTGRALVERFRSLGREDLHYQGQRLGRIRIRHEGCDYQPVVELWHPKQGKAYADSYGLQKRIEAYQPGGKPDVLAVGHWHAYCHLAKRGVHAIAVPCFQGGGSGFSNSLPGAPVIGGVILSYALTPHGTMRRAAVEVVQYFESEQRRTVLDAGAVG